jgi:predicted metalloendopeptidase
MKRLTKKRSKSQKSPKRQKSQKRPNSQKSHSNCAAADDFYATQNKSWNDATQIPDTESRITQAYFIHKRVNKELASIVEKQEQQKQRGDPIPILLSSWRAAESAGIPTGITPILQVMLSMETPSDIAGRIGWMNRYGISSPLAIYVQGDPRNHGRCRVFIDEGMPHIGTPEYWLWSEYAGHRRAYATYVNRLAELLHLPGLTQGYGAEREFAQIFPNAEERKKRMNMLNWHELCTRFHSIDWRTMFITKGLPEEQLPRLMYNVSSLPFMHRLQRRFRTWKLSRWQGWFALCVAQWIAGRSPHGPLRSAWFAYTRRYLQGITEDENVASLRTAIVRSSLPDALGRLWVRNYCDPGLRRSVTAMAERIRAAALNCLKGTEWMSATTRAAAITKLRSLRMEICWPAPWPDSSLPATELSPDILVTNLLALADHETNKNNVLLTTGKGCRHPTGSGWDQPVFVVNAFYFPDENRFILPAAILRSPFYDPAASIPTNYGGIGATIGHELCHAFDSEGRAYDARGDKREWWSAASEREYDQRARQMVKRTESRKYRGMKVDGTLTLVENIADLGGVEFALAGAASALGRPMTKAELREFFVSYAVSWRAKDRRKRAAQLLMTDSHAPPMLRVNHIVRHFDEWYEAFDVSESCPEAIPPAQRIRFFRAEAEPEVKK